MCLEGPEGSITKAGTDPELQGGDVVMGALGDPIVLDLSTEREEEEVERKWWEEGREGPQDWLTDPDRKGFFHTSAEHTLSPADV